MVDFDQVIYLKDPRTHRSSEGAERYHKWLQERYRLSVCQDAGALVARAQSEVQSPFLEWMRRYVAE
ncbi:MAG: hypothetical protein HY319_21075 [Armatimonadetes bacterium]|nr:hypothetical protein [Armatimonadota bacterium]